MKRKSLPPLAAAVLAAGCLTTTGCSDDTTTVAPAGTAYVTLDRAGNASEDSFTVRMPPSDNALRFEYALSDEADRGDNPTPPYEIPVSTPAEGEQPTK